MSKTQSRLTNWLNAAPLPLFVLFAIGTSFSTYFCMYAFRKPFSAATFAGQSFFGTQVDLKTALVLSQIVGYTLSKYIGIKVCSEITPGQRRFYLVSMIFYAEASLVIYGLVPDRWKFLAIFLNGLPLGMVWGLVVWYLEGRRISEVLLAGLSLSYIQASGVVKNVGQVFMGEYGVSEGWMPAVTGGVFLGPFLLSVWLLNQIPKPTVEDERARTHRERMDGVHRLAFVRHFFWGVVMLSIAYFFLTAYRDYRDNYQRELFEELGYQYDDVTIEINGGEATIHENGETRVTVDGKEVAVRNGDLVVINVAGEETQEVILRKNDQIRIDEEAGEVLVKRGDKTIITQAETIVMFGVAVPLGLLFLIRKNRVGLLCTYLIMIAGILLLSVSTWAYQSGALDGFWWMTLVGLGAYMAYVPYGSVLFDRLIASTHIVGTAVFAIYIMDAIGYTGSAAVQIYRDIIYRGPSISSASRLNFFIDFTYFMSALGTVMLIGSCIYFLVGHRRKLE